jgi:hypothetical protein
MNELPSSARTGGLSPGGRLGAWLVTGPGGGGLALVIDFAVALRAFLAERRS